VDCLASGRRCACLRCIFVTANELVEESALFQTAATRIGPLWLPQVRPVSSCSPASYPPMPLTPKRSKSDEATGLYSAAFQAMAMREPATIRMTVRRRRGDEGRA